MLRTGDPRRGTLANPGRAGGHGRCRAGLIMVAKHG
jgi:hypothetical protein